MFDCLRECCCDPDKVRPIKATAVNRKKGSLASKEEEENEEEEEEVVVLRLWLWFRKKNRLFLFFASDRRRRSCPDGGKKRPEMRLANEGEGEEEEEELDVAEALVKLRNEEQLVVVGFCVETEAEEPECCFS